MSNDGNSRVGRSDEVFSADYLAAKKYIDDAALNSHVLRSLRRVLPAGRSGEPLQVLEVGGGIGTMLVRLLEREAFAGPIIYHLTDNDATHLQAAGKYLSGWAERQGLTLSWSAEQCFRVLTAKADITVVLEELDLHNIEEHVSLRGVYDLVLAHGVLDLFDFSLVLPPLFRCLKGSGCIYFTCNFDGETVFLPEHPADRQIVRYYHESMEKRIPGANRTGRRLLSYLHDQQWEILSAGNSDWVIHPSSRDYSEAQKVFLLAIIDMVEQALAEQVNKIPGLLIWIRQRRQQIEEGSLFFLAKHLDILARNPSSS
jgi:hypothetical protein